MRIRSRLLILITTIAIACAQWVPAFAVSEADLDLEAEAAILMDAETGQILYSKNAYTPMEPASTTKIMTCLLALEHLDMEQEITVKSDAVQMGSIIDVKEGEVFTAEQLLYACMIASANDASIVLAEEIAGSEEAFCRMMNDRAAECGAKDTNFQNSNGLNWAWHDNHKTTAYDLAMITKAALENDTFREIINTRIYEIPATNKSDERRLITTNRIMWTDEIHQEVQDMENEKENPQEVFRPEEYPGAFGVKTGYTSTAGACAVSVLDFHGVELIAVVLDSGEESRYSDMMAMWDYATAEYYDTHLQVAAGEEVTEVRVSGGKNGKVQAVASEDVMAALPKGESADKLKTDVEKDRVEAPVKAGDKVGVINVYNGRELINQVDLVAAEDVEEGRGLKPLVISIAVLLILIAAVRYRIKQLKRKAARKRREERRRKNV